MNGETTGYVRSYDEGVQSAVFFRDIKIPTAAIWGNWLGTESSITMRLVPIFTLNLVHWPCNHGQFLATQKQSLNLYRTPCSPKCDAHASIDGNALTVHILFLPVSSGFGHRASACARAKHEYFRFNHFRLMNTTIIAFVTVQFSPTLPNLASIPPPRLLLCHFCWLKSSWTGESVGYWCTRKWTISRTYYPAFHGHECFCCYEKACRMANFVLNFRGVISRYELNKHIDHFMSCLWKIIAWQFHTHYNLGTFIPLGRCVG